jgi:uncharacterized protein (TIGR02466 family)
MSVDLFFGVPLVVQDVDPAIRESIRNKVSAFLKSERARETVTPAPEESVSTSFYRREVSILVDAKLDELEALIVAAARSYLERTLKLPPRRVEIEHAWINVFEPGSQEGQHTHDGSLLSCSYYVDAPENCGCIVFPDPIGARRSYREFTETSGQELLNRREIAVEPKPGRLIMFESWVPHYIQCNKSDKVRISIAINLRSSPVIDKSSQPLSHQDAVVDVKAGVSRSAPASDVSDSAAEDGKPFLFNELFEVNPGASATLEPIQDSIPTIVIDDFLRSPDRVRGVVGRTPAANWKHEPGGRNFSDYYDCRLRFPIRYPNPLIAAAQKAIQKVFGLNTRPADPSVDVNWFMQINDKRGDFAVPHADMTENVTRSFTCILYLNRPEECSGGTAFFRFKASDSLVIDEGYARAVKEDARISESGLDYWPEATEDLWEQVGVIDMLPGRLLIFPSQYFHSAYHPRNSFYDFPRLTLAFWMIS